LRSPGKRDHGGRDEGRRDGNRSARLRHSTGSVGVGDQTPRPEPPPDPLVVNSKARRDNSQGADELDKGTRQHIQQALQVNITMQRVAIRRWLSTMQ